LNVERTVLSVTLPREESAEEVFRIPNNAKKETKEEFHNAWRAFLMVKMSPIALFSTLRIRREKVPPSSLVTIEAPGSDTLWLEPNIPFPFNPEYAKAYHSLLIGLISLGPELENIVSKAFKDGDSYKGWMLDRMGTQLLRKAFSVFLNQRKQASEGYFGPRYAPGCPPIPLAGQKSIFDLLEASQEGMRLTQGYMIYPVKTTSFVMGVGARPILNEPSLCQTCQHASICKDEAEESIF
jgi:hypothetical protein